MGNMKVFLKAGDQLYLNGANFRVDRKVSIELLNQTKFLLADHVMSPEQADTPLKRLYFTIQLMILDAPASNETLALYRSIFQSIMQQTEKRELNRLLLQVDRDVRCGREYQALKSIRQHLDPQLHTLSRA